MILATLFVFFATAIIILFRWLKEKHKFWEKLNIKTAKPLLLFGHSYQQLLGRKHASQVLKDEYLSFPNEDMIGHYHYMTPHLILRSPELIQKVLIKDFTHFTDRFEIRPGMEKSPLLNNLFTMGGNRWRALRYQLSPMFTTGKLKYMFGSMSDCGENLEAHLDSKDGKDVDMKDVNSLFAMDVIGSCAFGIDAGVLRDPSSTFCMMGKKMFDTSMVRVILRMIVGLIPKLKAIFNIPFTPKKVTDYFNNLVLNTMNERKKKVIQRNDFVQLLMQLQEKGSIQMPFHDPTDDYLKIEKTSDVKEFPLTDDLLIGTALTFIFAGFHTTATTMTYTFHELAHKLKIQEKAREEIRKQISHHGSITYEALKSMTYVDNILKETMRLHPAVPLLLRTCTKEYTFPNGLKLKPGNMVLIPVLGLHHDPKFFPNPLHFNPERFDSDPELGTYLPFGEGPRICIAKRFAHLQMKFALAKILSSYKVTPNENTKTSLPMETRQILMIPKGKASFKVEKI